MPRKKKSETESSSLKAAPKPKRSTAAKASPKAADRAPKKTAASKTPKAVPAKKTASAARVKAVPAPKPEAASSSKAHALSFKKQARHGETQMVAFIRDPHCIFTYWEVTPESVESVKKQLMEEYKGSTMVLRVFRTAPDGQSELIQEIRVEPGEMNRYVELKENSGSYFIEIAQKTASGRTVVYARSNRVMTGTAAESQGGQAAAGAGWEAPAGILEYFSDTEESTAPLVTGGISSAEAHRRTLARKKMDRYSASRMG